jgi:uncharacterized protein
MRRLPRPAAHAHARRGADRAGADNGRMASPSGLGWRARIQQRAKALVPSRESLVTNRWLRWLGPSLLHPKLWHLGRRTVAIGAAVGVFFAFITPVAQIPASAVVSVVLRCNLPAAVVGTLVNTPPTFGPVYYAAWKVGAWVLREPATARPAAMAPSTGPTSSTADLGWLDRLRQVGKPLLLGALIFAVVGALLTYGLVSAVWRWRVRARRRQRRLATG